VVYFKILDVHVQGVMCHMTVFSWLTKHEPPLQAQLSPDRLAAKSVL
jgi:hypothetical protein